MDPVMGHRYSIDQICIFTNRGTSGVTKYDGRKCTIVRLKPAEEWFQGEPEYVVRFLDENHSFGVRERELQPCREKG